MFIDLAEGNQRLGACWHTIWSIGAVGPDMNNLKLLSQFFFIHSQTAKDLYLYHDRSDGGLAISREMAFGGRCGLKLDISKLGTDPLSILFNEEAGAVIEDAHKTFLRF